MKYLGVNITLNASDKSFLDFLLNDIDRSLSYLQTFCRLKLSQTGLLRNCLFKQNGHFIGLKHVIK